MAEPMSLLAIERDAGIDDDIAEEYGPAIAAAISTNSTCNTACLMSARHHCLLLFKSAYQHHVGSI